MATALAKPPKISREGPIAEAEPAAISQPKRGRAERQMLHGPALASHVYNGQLKSFANDPDLRDSAFGHASDVIARLDCRDPLEEMLAMQALWAHARVARLSSLANRQDGRDNLRVINESCDRASDTYRKLMLALAEYRRPPRVPDVRLTAFGQTNVAQQQVVHQVAGKPTNEQG